jgi:hypothetical protein
MGNVKLTIYRNARARRRGIGRRRHHGGRHGGGGRWWGNWWAWWSGYYPWYSPTYASCCVDVNGTIFCGGLSYPGTILETRGNYALVAHASGSGWYPICV